MGVVGVADFVSNDDAIAADFDAGEALDWACPADFLFAGGCAAVEILEVSVVALLIPSLKPVPTLYLTRIRPINTPSLAVPPISWP